MQGFPGSKEKEEYKYFESELDRLFQIDYEEEYNEEEDEEDLGESLEYIYDNINDTLTMVWRRLYSKAGGAANDISNFSNSSDFNWLREEIEDDFRRILYYDLKSEQQDFIEDQKNTILSHIDLIEEINSSWR
jgi:hypothetical protein